ncbi:MAG: MarR family winged helix-turn-helix transcriptional regulator, partial [Sporomusa sp.]
KQSVNLIIKTFLKQGYIEMKEIDSDRRIKALKLSKSGRAYADKVMEKLYQADEAAFKQLTDEERQAIVEIMKKMEQGFREKLE